MDKNGVTLRRLEVLFQKSPEVHRTKCNATPPGSLISPDGHGKPRAALLLLSGAVDTFQHLSQELLIQCTVSHGH